MEPKKVTVTLQVGEKTQDFEINHAERILRREKNGGWRLPENSEFKMDSKNGLISRSNKGKSSES